MEQTPKISNDKEKIRNKIFPWTRKILGASVLAGGIAFGVDQAWDQYQETQNHKDREDGKKRGIEMAEQSLQKNTKSLDSLDEKLDFGIIENDAVPSVDKSIDSLKGLLQDLETQKESGAVSYETLVKIQNLTKYIETSLDSSSTETSDLLSTIYSIDSNIEALSKTEASKELSGYITEFLGSLMRDKEIIKHISEHPSATKRMLESVERYKDVFSDYYVDPEITKDEKITSLVDSLHIGVSGENSRIVYTLVKMQKEGILNDFFESLGTKINAVLIAGRFENRISLSKNFLEVEREENFKKLKDDPSILIGLEEEMKRPISKEEASDVAAVSHIFYSSAHDFFALFSKDNAEEIEEFIEGMTKNKELSEGQKEEIARNIREFGKKVQDLLFRLEESEK